MRENLSIFWNMPRGEEEILKVSKMLHLQNQRWCGAYYGELRQMLENYGWQESWTQRLMAVLVVQASLLCLSACAASSLLCCCCLCCCSAASLPSQCSALTSSRHSAGVWRELECDAKRNIGIQWRETVHSLSVVVWTKCIKYKGRMRGRRACYCCLLLCWSLLFLAAFLPFSPVSCNSQQRISRYVRKSQQPD